LGELWFEARPANVFQDPHLQKARAKWTGGEVQVVECLLCKCKALSSNPTLTKKKNQGLSYLGSIYVLKSSLTLVIAKM
jgi:hypothetical protein